MRRALLTTLALIACAAVLPAVTDARKPRHAHARTPDRVQLLSTSASGGFPNGPSHDGVISQDAQLATLAAFDSDASNIVSGDSNGTTDVFLVHRTGKISSQGPPWVKGKTQLISRAYDGGAANGPSYKPDIDGEQAHGPTCVAFVSAASNLVPGDTNGVPDAFVYNIRTHRITRVSVGSYGEQANGATYEVKVDGHCDRVAFVSDATNLGLGATGKLSWRSAITGPAPAGVKQVYVRVLTNRTDNAGLAGLTFLASASAGGEPGNADSTGISLARAGGGCGFTKRCGQFSAEAVFFASEATNLVGGDTNGVSDVFMRGFLRRSVRMYFPHGRRVDGQIVRNTNVGVGPLQLSTKLISSAAGGGPANGPSDQPAATESGSFVAYRTAASNIVPGDANRAADVVRLNTLTGKTDLVSRTASGQQANGPSGHPAIGRTGLDLLFESAAGNLEQNDHNCQSDIYHLDIPHDRQVFTSLDSLNRIPNYVFGSRAACPNVIAAPTVNPAVSYYLNYATWETSWPLMDAQLGKRTFGNIGNDRAAVLSNTQPNLHQVYLRYLGPR